MTVSNTVRKAGPFVGNGVTTAFPFTFKVLAASDLVVTKQTVAGVISVLVLNSNYTVTLNPNQETSPGGSVTYNSLALNEKLSITTNISPTQPVDITVGTGFYPPIVEGAFDRAVLLIQQLIERVSRTLRIPVTDTGTINELPVASLRANKALIFDASGQPTVSTDDYEDQVANVAASAAAAAASANSASISAGQAAASEAAADVSEAAAAASAAAAAATLVSVNAAGATQIGLINTAGANQVTNVNSAGATNVAAVENEGTEQRALIGSLTSSIVPSVTNYTGDGVTTQFTMPSSPPSENMVRAAVNTAYQQRNTFSIAGNVLTFASAPANGASIEIEIMGTVALGVSTSSGISYVAQGTGTIARAMNAWLDDFPNAKSAGALADNVSDDTLLLQAMINNAIADGESSLEFPAGTYKISDELTVSSPLLLIGKGARRTVIRQTGAAKNGINFNYASLATGGGVIGMTIEAGAGFLTGGFQGQGSSGIGISVQNANDLFVCERFAVHNFATGVKVAGCFYANFDIFRILYCTTAGVILDRSVLTTGAGNTFRAGKISNFGFTGTNTASMGIQLLSSGGEFFNVIDVTSFNNAVVAQPPAGKQVLYPFFDTVLADTSDSDGWVFDATNDKVWSVQCVNCWAGYSTNGAGMVTKGANLDSVRWIGGRLRENGKEGWHHQSGINCELVGTEVATNSKLTANTYDGILVDAGVSSWGVENCRIGNFASSLGGQANNIRIAAGASQAFRIIGNDLSNPGAGKVPLANGSSSLNYIISRNLPLQNQGANTSDKVSLTGGSITAPAAGLTGYLGAGGFVGGVSDSPYMMNRAGLITEFYVAVGAAPGAGESFTYTVMKNGVATSMTGAISGTGVFSLYVTTNAFTVAVQDQISLRLVTSAAAVATKHRFYMTFEP